MRITFACKFMTYNYHIKQPMQAVEMKLNMIVAKKRNLLKSPKRFHNHALIKSYSHIPFNI